MNHLEKIKLQESSSSKKQKSNFKNQKNSEQFWYNAQKIKFKPKSTHKRWSVALDKSSCGQDRQLLLMMTNEKSTQKMLQPQNTPTHFNGESDAVL